MEFLTNFSLLYIRFINKNIEAISVPQISTERKCKVNVASCALYTLYIHEPKNGFHHRKGRFSTVQQKNSCTF